MRHLLLFENQSSNDLDSFHVWDPLTITLSSQHRLQAWQRQIIFSHPSRHFSLTRHWWGVALMSVPCLSSGFLVLTAIGEKNIYTGPCRLYYASWIFFLKTIGSQWRILNRSVMWFVIWSKNSSPFLTQHKSFPKAKRDHLFQVADSTSQKKAVSRVWPLALGAVSQPREHCGPGDPKLWEAVCLPASLPTPH